MKKYANVNDILDAIEESSDQIEIYKEDERLANCFGRQEKLRLSYLYRLLYYINNETLVPLISADVLKDDVKLQEFVIPLLKIDKLSKKECGK